MTIQRARELLGNEIERLSDKEVQQMIDRDFMLCDVLLDVIMVVPKAMPKAMLTNYEKQN